MTHYFNKIENTYNKLETYKILGITKTLEE